MPAAFQEIRRTLTLALPIMAGQLGQMLMGVTDTLMIGRLGTVELAASAFVNVLFHIPIVLGIALASAVSVQVSHRLGAGDPRGAGDAFRHGVLLVSLVGLVVTAILLGCLSVLDVFGQPAEVVAAIPPYLFWVALSVLPMMPTLVGKSFAESNHHPWPVFFLMMAGVGINVVLNALLIFGLAGFPALGLAGAGLATFIARMLTCFAVVWYLQRSRTLALSRPTRWMIRPDPVSCVSLARMAAPISGQILLEFGAFAAVTLLIGHFGSVPLAAHQIAITLAATTFMLPLGLSMALTIRVGHSIGAGEVARCRRIIGGAFATGLSIMASTALIFITFRHPIASLFSQDPAVIELAASLLVITAIFQLFDGAQILGIGALRGFKDLTVPTLLILMSYWLVALPLGIVLGFAEGREAIGLWMGLATGLGVAAFSLGARLWQQLRKADR